MKRRLVSVVVLVLLLLNLSIGVFAAEDEGPSRPKDKYSVSCCVGTCNCHENGCKCPITALCKCCLATE